MTTAAVLLTIVSGLVTLTLFEYAIIDLWALASGLVSPCPKVALYYALTTAVGNPSPIFAGRVGAA